MDVKSTIHRSLKRAPQRTAIANLETGDRYTYAELSDWLNSVANGLSELGIEEGDRVATCLPNVPELPVTFLATQELGAILVPFNFRVSPEGLKYHVNDSGSSVLVANEMVQEKVETVRDELECDTIVYVGDDAPAYSTPFETLEAAPATAPTTEITGNDPSTLVYTSGTTGDPKGVLLDHEACMSRVHSGIFNQNYEMGETMVGGMPLFHTVGLHAVFLTIMTLSGTYVMLPQLDPNRYIKAIEEEEITALHEAPTIYHMLLNADGVSETDFDSVKRVCYSGSPMSPTVFEQVIETFDPDLISNAYGTTEMYGPIAWENLLQYGKNPSQIGRNADIFDSIRIVDPDKRDPDATVDKGKDGHLIVSMDSPEAFTEYWNKPKKTDEVIVDGWYFTGDIAFRDDDDFVQVNGRIDNMIISGGENIYPPEVEDLLVTHPNIEEAAVIGVQDEKWGEIPKAFIVPSTEGVLTEEVEKWCLDNKKLADFKRPRVWEVVDELPRNPSGKLMRYKLREN